MGMGVRGGVEAWLKWERSQGASGRVAGPPQQVQVGSNYPAKEFCSQCGLCDTYYIAHVSEGGRSSDPLACCVQRGDVRR